MTTIVQVEFRESLLSIRDEIFKLLGQSVIFAIGRALDYASARCLPVAAE